MARIGLIGYGYLGSYVYEQIQTRPELGLDIAHTDYMPLSLTCLAETALERTLLAAAVQNDSRLYVPHGAVIGLDALSEGREMWEEVTITMKKPPRSIDFADSPDYARKDIDAETVLYDGPTRTVCAHYPRNVNSHAATALAGIGFDRTRSILVADPRLDVSLIELSARGQGVEIDIRRANPMQGVSGVMTLLSSLASICRVKAPGAGLQIC
jgi:aspartate dehydrogenase